MRRAMPTIATILAVALFVVAGNWQRARLQEKERLGAQLEAADARGPVALPSGVRDWSPWRFRSVELRGAFDAARQVLIDNRVHAGRAGFAVVTPLVLDDGRAVLVDRGWVAAGPSRKELPLVPPPAGHVVVLGRIALPARYFALGDDAPAGPVRQHLDPARFASTTGLAVLPIVIEQSTESAPADGLVRERAKPDTGSEPHRSYMLQWYGFALLAAGLWAWFHLRAKTR